MSFLKSFFAIFAKQKVDAELVRVQKKVDEAAEKAAKEDPKTQAEIEAAIAIAQAAEAVKNARKSQ